MNAQRELCRAPTLPLAVPPEPGTRPATPLWGPHQEFSERPFGTGKEASRSRPAYFEPRGR